MLKLLTKSLFVLSLSYIAGIAMADTSSPESVAAAGHSEKIGDGIVAFLPPGVKDYPASLALIKPPISQGQQPPDWAIRPQFVKRGAGTQVIVSIPDGVDMYGTGEVTGPLRRNGSKITLWNTDNFEYARDGGSQLYQSHPWVLGVRKDGSAFGVLFDSTWRAELDTGQRIVFASSGPPMPVIVIDRVSPQAVLQGLAELTGKMPLPPRWALGYQQSRWSYTPDTHVLDIADEFRKRKIPVDVIWMDIDYMDGFRVFTFSPKDFPDPKRLNNALHERGFHAVWMIDPGVKFDPGYTVYDSGTAHDVWVKDAHGAEYHGEVWPGEVAYPDFTMPSTRNWWSALYKGFMAQGIDGVWNDMNEPSVFKVPSMTMPDDNWHRGGGELSPGSHLQYHNVYGMLMARATREGIQAALPDRRPFVLTRANFLGGQRYAATWTGDNTSTWEHLKMSIPMSINLGLSGQPFSGPDIGGFSGEATPDLWANWIAIGAFYPFSRAHTIKAVQQKEPWAFGPAVEHTARIAIERRYRLLPYLYTLFHGAAVDGSPVMQPVFFADPADLRLRSEDQAFLLGRDLLVIPAWAHQPALPKGIWRKVSLIDGEAADPYQATLKLRGGAIVPLGKVVQNTNEESLDPLTLLVCLDAHGEAQGTLYEDAGEGYGYRHGDYRLTYYRARRQGDTVHISIASSDGKRRAAAREVVVQVVTDDGVFTGKGQDGKVVVPL